MEGNVPEIRLKGFTGAWVQRKLGDILKVNSGRDYKHLNYGDIPVYGTGGYMLSVNDSLSEEDAIGIGRKGTIDKPQFLKAPFWTVDTLFFITPKPNNDLSFLFALSQDIEWAKLDESTSIPSLSKTNIDSILRYVPEFDEQTAIGEFFRTLDENITLHKQKLDGLRKLKKGYLQQMFPQTGEIVPKVRLKGFTKPWTERKLSNSKDIRDGTHDSPKFYEHGHPLVTSKNLTETGLDMTNTSFISSDDFELINKRSKVDVGDIIFGMIGTIGNPVIVDRDDFAIKNVALIKNGGGIPNIFLIQHLKTHIFENYIHIENAGNTQKFLSLGKIRDYTLLTPSCEEMTLIGNFLHNIDRQITAQHQKVEQLKELKAAYLQKMFV